MPAPQLLLTKRMALSHGKVRPVIEVRAVIGNPAAQAFLLEHFPNETLFKRTAYASGFTDGGLQASPPLTRMLGNFIKNDACPEITVKTLTAGQKYEGLGLWDVLCFEFIAKRAFDALCELADGAASFGSPDVYLGFDRHDASAALAVLAAGAMDEMAPAPAPVAIGSVQGMADAA